MLVDSIAAGLFPELPPAEDDFGWVRCGYCSPDGLGYADGRRRWRAHRGDPALARLVALVDPDAAAGGAR